MARGAIGETHGSKRHGACLPRLGGGGVAFAAGDIVVLSQEREFRASVIE